VSTVVSLSEPARVMLMGVGLLLVGRWCASRSGRPDRTSSGLSITSAIALILLASVATSCAKNPEVAKRTYLESGDRYFAGKKYPEAIVQYRNAVQQDARFGEARYKLATAYARVNDLPGAYREYIRAADLMPGNMESQLKAGQMLVLARQFEDAKARADQILARDPKNVEAHILRGTALAGSKNLDAAIDQIEEAIALDPDRSSAYDDLGALQLAKGDREEAERAFSKAVELDDKSVPARLALATFYLSTRRAAEAEGAFKQALALDAANPTANRALALLYLSSDRAASAEPYLKTFAEASKTAAARMALADYYTRMIRTSDAIQILTAVDVADSHAFAEAQSRLAAIEYGRGQLAAAHTRLNDLLARQPKYVAGLVLQARFHLAEHDIDGALAQTKAAIEADPTSVVPQFLLGAIDAATGRHDEAAKAFSEVMKLNPRAAIAQIALARVQLAGGKIDASIESVRQALKSRPDHPDARLLLARGLTARRDLAAAESETKVLLARHPNVAAVHSQMGVLCLTKRDHDAAKRAFERALALDGHSFEARAGLVLIDLAAKKVTEARTRVEAALTLTPNDARLLALAASIFAATGDSGRAEQVLHHAITLDASNIQVRTMLARLFMSQQKLEEARAQFDELAKRRPDTTAATTAQTMVGLILSAQKRPDEAQRQYEQILATSPREVVAANNLAWLYAERGGNLDVALGLAQTAAQQDPDDPAINDTLGWVFYKKGLTSHAVAALRRSVEKAPANPLYRYHLGLAFAKNGDQASAKQALQKALTLNPNFEYSSDARKVLTRN
jgi:putative PEP-CTERM system TPR-repeat lipoprotein